MRPRTELLLAKRSEAGKATHYRRVSTGIVQLDKMLQGGLLASSTTLLLGFSGSGKTLVSQHFLDAGAAKQEPGLYFGFYETASVSRPPRRSASRCAHTARRSSSR